MWKQDIPIEVDPNSKLHFEYKDVAPEELSVVPGLNFEVGVAYITNAEGQH